MTPEQQKQLEVKWNIVLVVCPNQREFGSYRDLHFFKSEIRSSNSFIFEDTKYIWVSSPKRMRGYHNCKVIFYGNYLEMPNLDEYEKEAIHARSK